MRDYGKIKTSLWRSKKFGSVSDSARLLYLYYHTCSHVNSVGCFEMIDQYGAYDLGWDVPKYAECRKELEEIGLVCFDSEENILRIVKFLEMDPFTNGKHASGSIAVAMKLPDCREKYNLFKEMMGMNFVDVDEKYNNVMQSLSIPYRNPIDTLSEPYRSPEPEPEPKPKPDPEPEPILSSFSGENDTRSEKQNSDDSCNWVIDEYNKIAEHAGWSKVKLLTATRKSKIKARAKTAGGYENLVSIIDWHKDEPFMRGDLPKSDWKADFDFFMQLKSFTKCMEGTYLNKNEKKTLLQNIQRLQDEMKDRGL